MLSSLRFHVLFLFFVSAMFSVSLASLFGYHVYLVSRNMTTLEAFRPPVFRHGPDKFAFHLGKISNFQVSVCRLCLAHIEWRGGYFGNEGFPIVSGLQKALILVGWGSKVERAGQGKSSYNA